MEPKKRYFMLPDGRGAWADAHNAARHRGHPVLDMAYALRSMAERHRDRFLSPIGEDYVLGAAWLLIANGLIDMLNGDIGGLDGGTIDRSIRDLAEEHGFTRDLEFAP